MAEQEKVKLSPSLTSDSPRSTVMAGGAKERTKEVTGMYCILYVCNVQSVYYVMYMHVNNMYLCVCRCVYVSVSVCVLYTSVCTVKSTTLCTCTCT